MLVVRPHRLCNIAIRCKFRTDFTMNPISASGQFYLYQSLYRSNVQRQQLMWATLDAKDTAVMCRKGRQTGGEHD